MKYDYESMTTDELYDLYDQVFFPDSYGVNLGDYSDHRDRIIECIESGIPQDESLISTYSPMECVVFD